MAKDDLQPEVLSGYNYPNSSAPSLPAMPLSIPDNTLSGVSRGTSTWISTDGSKMLIGNLPNNEFGIAFYNPQGVLVTKYVGPTRFVYNPSDSNVNVMQDGKLPDNTYGWHIAAPTKNVADGFS